MTKQFKPGDKVLIHTELPQLFEVETRWSTVKGVEGDWVYVDDRAFHKDRGKMYKRHYSTVFDAVFHTQEEYDEWWMMKQLHWRIYGALQDAKHGTFTEEQYRAAIKALGLEK